MAAFKSTANVAGMIFRLPSSQTNRFIDAEMRRQEGEDVSLLEYLLGAPPKK